MTDRRSLPVPESSALPSLVRSIEALVAAGVDWLQIREKDLSARELAELTRESLRRTAPRAGTAGRTVRILVNDRVDVALTEGAGGVHLGESSLPVSEVRRLVDKHAPKDFLLGVSCHSLESAKAAQRDGASYIFFGPVFATPSKEAFGTPQGLESLSLVCRSVSIPVLAIGGITLDNAAACGAAGAAGIAAIRLFQEATDPAGVIDTLRRPAR